MARKIGIERLVVMLADHIRVGVTANLREFLGEQFRRIEASIVRGRAGARGRTGRGPGRPRKGSGRVAAGGAAIEKRRKKALAIVQGSGDGITSVDVARRMRVDARGVGKLLAGLARDKAVKKDGRLYFPA